MSNDDFQGLVDNANRMNPHHHRHHGVELLMAGLVSGLVAGAVQNRQQARAKAEYEARARYQARFEVPNVYRPIDLATGLYHPQHAGNRQEAYDDLLVGLGVAEDATGSPSTTPGGRVRTEGSGGCSASWSTTRRSIARGAVSNTTTTCVS